MRILCATDRTSPADAAMSRANWLAARRGGQVTLVHAPFSDTGAFAAIVHAALSCKADVIVLTAPQTRRLDSLVGTSAERLLRRTGLPVLVVRDDSAGDYDHAVVAADLTAASGPMLCTAVGLLGLARSNATLVHALQEPYDSSFRLAGLEQATLDEYQRAFEEKARTALRELARQAGLPSATTRVEVRSQPAIQAILDLLDRDRPDLLALGANRWFMLKRLTMGSVADQALRGAHCDVLVIPQRRSTPAPERGLRARAGQNVPSSAWA